MNADDDSPLSDDIAFHGDLFGFRHPLTTIVPGEPQPTFDELCVASRSIVSPEFSTPMNHVHRDFRHQITKYVNDLVPSILSSSATRHNSLACTTHGSLRSAH